jgi:hypothetical protein
MGYPETTDAFAITDIKNWSTFTRKEVRTFASAVRITLTNLSASSQEV